MLNILLIAEDTSKLLNKNFYYLENELSNLANLTLWRKQGHISHILKQIPTRPDFILLFNDIDTQMTPMIKGLANIDISTGLFVTDVHRFISLRRNYIDKNKISNIFTVARDKFMEIYPEYKNKMIWLPNFVNTELYKDYGLKKELNFLMMGAVNDTYPLRQTICNTYKNDKNFVYHNHPGYRTLRNKEKEQSFIGDKYAKEINRAKLFFTCPSIYNYPVMKYFEVLACRTLLLAPTFKELEDLGFIPGKHFVPIDKKNFKDKATYYLVNDREREKIVEEGYRFIHGNHSVKQRAKQIIQKIESIVK
ncbi:glycosyltransferase [Oceanobacillus bengalensis]|uniref:Glycosyltransferase family 1 protein n=1 Tax=Oceanobacillus bengalensis TaxID=1435466 RepID=A0A494Z4Z7_9BACI|nr:glycosyltransferase [Oceanobacillus bengalensis]RKQ17554.1 glycosyltransferase family 1 protein [Oceanobacillus bengalensis]